MAIFFCAKVPPFGAYVAIPETTRKALWLVYTLCDRGGLTPSYSSVKRQRRRFAN